MIQTIIQKILMRRATLFAIALLFTTHFASACTESTAMMPTITYPVLGDNTTDEQCQGDWRIISFSGRSPSEFLTRWVK